jgi:DNA-binding CsgD family transcriptional regulator
MIGTRGIVTYVEPLLGRERELAAVGRFLGAIEGGRAAALLEGEPGIGKTALFKTAIDAGRKRGCVILAATPTNAESALSFVGLTDLLSDVHELFAELPSPQRHALEAALLLDDVPDAPPDPRAIGSGLLSVLRRLAESRPILVAIDDLQWLDTASTAALSFALRRLTDEPIGLLAATRTNSDDTAADLIRSMDRERISLGPLSVGAIHALLGERLQLSIPRSLLLRVHETCRGNPLFALEIGRALQERGLPEPGQPLEMPADAEAAFSARLDQLPLATLDALAVTAASAAPTGSLVSKDALQPAVRAGMIHLDAEQIHFTHPLIASAAYARLDSTARRELHRRIADSIADREERARHLALAATGPDRDVAVALDQATEHAFRRGAAGAAAELAELAVKLTPRSDTSALHTRELRSAEHHYRAGDVARSRGIAERLVDELPSGPERSRALLQLAETYSGDLMAMLPPREEAVVEAAGDDRALVQALRWLAHTLFVAGRPVEALVGAREALAAAERTEDRRLLAVSSAYLAWLEMLNGEITPGLLEQALTLEEDADYLREYESPRFIEGLRAMHLADDLESARTHLLDAEGIARDHGDDGTRAIVLAQLGQLECRAGRFEAAAGYAAESLELREQFGLGTGAHLYQIALADALRGRVEAARASAERGLELCEETGNEIFTVRNLYVLGFLALSTGNPTVADEILAPLPERLRTAGYGCVNVLQVLPDAIEASIAVGDVDHATAQLEELNGTAALGILYALVRAARCRGLLTSAVGEQQAALAAFEDALAGHERLPDPLERGRTLLALGQTLRRAGHRRDAREALQGAQSIFEEIGAALWTAQARAERARLGGRTPSGRALTGAEDRVARLVAQGKTNREVAAALFVTERTVETHLSSIYRKLHLRSRSELARLLAGANGEQDS